MNLKTKLNNLRDALSQNLIERETPIRLTLLAALSGEHLLLLGPPGTAKSELARRLKQAFNGGNYFERLLTRFSVPEELFGPLSIKALEEDRYERLTSRYLPTATVAFIDEIFKANSAILNSLLTLLNEREFDNGVKRDKTPLSCVVGASNELPEGEELDALYDRFLLRYKVMPVSKEGFVQLLKLKGNPKPKPELAWRLTVEELQEIQESAELVKIPDDVMVLLQELRIFLDEQKIYVSDRRWRKIVKLLQVAALTNDKNEVSIWDCWLLQHCLWAKSEQRESIFDWYQSRVGTKATFNPENFNKLVAAWEKKLEDEKNSQTQDMDEEGNLLYLDEKGGITTQTKGEVPEYRNGEPLYLAPPEQQRNSIQDRTNQGKGYTVEEFKQHFCHHYRDRFQDGQQWIEIKDYFAENANLLKVLKDFTAKMESTRYSQHHINGRVEETDKFVRDITEYLVQIDEQISSLTQTINDHLWITPGFSEPAKSTLEKTRQTVEALRVRITTTRDGFSNLPVEE
ncbi:AAA family ATPase [Candidatus Parabeggiatoa sp. HSG14]|uniref:AAA family ATPase n=1 Tax=Candidatus Parabeggiatoa sp. HSG14 TaxID=3055593 RepID=UPI0025A883A5|nr:AAA family ATPase [Thiotrichales bacterium HSG14]